MCLKLQEQISVLTATVTSLVSALASSNHNMLYSVSPNNGRLKYNNLTQSNAENLAKIKEVEELMRLNKGMRMRRDGRYDWRKMIDGRLHYIINSCPYKLAKIVRTYKQQNIITSSPEIRQKEDRNKLCDLAREYYERYIKGEIASHKAYHHAINKWISTLTKNIAHYSEEEIYDFLKSITAKRQAAISFYLLRYVFASAAKKDIIKKNFMVDMKAPTGASEKGLWFNPDEQKLIYENRHISKIGNEIEFILMVGCRLSEALNCNPDFVKNRIFVKRTKANGTSGYVKISEKYSKFLQENFSKMFKLPLRVYSEEFGELLNILKIKRQTNEKPMHRLRHTFATNIYYFGIDDKKRSYLLGHKTTEVTNDIYTDFDPDIEKSDIAKIYKDLYPEF